MSKILIFAGTTEGRRLAQILVDNNQECCVCVATEYGHQVMFEHELISLHTGRLDVEGMKALIESDDFRAVVDATHPFATLVSENIRESLKGTGIPYLRLSRNVSVNENSCRMFDSVEECASALDQTEGNILLTTGSKDLNIFCIEGIRDRLFVRVLPGLESIELCYKAGLEGRQIIAMQGPFSAKMNEALISQYDIKCLVTKESGKTGGVDEKVTAASNCGISCFMIRKPQSSTEVLELDMEGVLDSLGISREKTSGLEVVLAGIGPGDERYITKEVMDEIEGADYIFGAERMIKDFEPRIAKYPYYLSRDILPLIENLQGKAVILFSGDTGFYSGCEKMYKALADLDGVSVKIMPGISSVIALAAKTAVSWQDANIISTHGIEKAVWSSKLLDSVKYSRKTFFISSGLEDVREIGQMLKGLDVKMYLGYQLSYEEEEVLCLKWEECSQLTKEGLYAGLILNEKPKSKPLAPGLSDECFIRDKVPMTKEEVREISICKLGLCENSVLYDIGSGTGSIAIESARLSPSVRVYAIETNEQALELIEKNRTKFETLNVELVSGMAPDALLNLPKASHAFIGGSKGNLKEILKSLYNINPKMRVVMNAVSMESICQMQEAIKEFSLENVDISQVSVSKAKQLGNYNMMQANNPVFIFAFDFVEEK